MQMSNAALRYLKEGKPIFPVGPDKKPLVPWKPYQETLPSEAQIVKWWELWPDANIGMATGKLSGFMVIDADSQESATRLANEHPEARQTRLVKTGRGWHIYFQYQEGIRNSVGKFAPGLDIRGEGGYVLLPPSKHETGAVYQWMNYNVLPLPEALAEKFLNGDPVYKGQRNDVLFRYGAGLRSKGFEEEAILTSLASENDRRCKPPLPEREIHAILKSIVKYPIGTKVEDMKPYDLNLVTAKAVVEGVDTEEYIWGQLLMSNCISLLIGQKGAGKSVLAMELAKSIAQGIPLLERPVKQGTVIYINIEGNRSLDKKILPPIENLLLHYGSTTPAIINQLESVVSDLKPTLIVVDILDKFFTIDDINKDYGAINRGLQKASNVARKYYCHIMFLHHAPWSNAERPLGSMSLGGSVDTELIVTGGPPLDHRFLKTGKQRGLEQIIGLPYSRKPSGPLYLRDLEGEKIDKNYEWGMEVMLANPGLSKRKFRIEMKGLNNHVADKVYETVVATLEANKNKGLTPENRPWPTPLPPTPSHTKEERSKEEKEKIEIGNLSSDAKRAQRNIDAQRLPGETLEAYALRLKTIFPDTISDWRLELDKRWKKNFPKK